MAASTIFFFKQFLLSPKRIRKSVGLLRKVQNVLQRTFKLFVRFHHDHEDITYDQTYIFVFHQKLESFRYNASLTIAGPIRRTFKEKRYQDLVQMTFLLC